jgi:hypothetical protein
VTELCHFLADATSRRCVISAHLFPLVAISYRHSPLRARAIAVRFNGDFDHAPMNIPFVRHRLDNGLDVLIHSDHNCPIVAVNVWYHVGSKNERPGRTGFAHLFEHLMFEGSEHSRSRATFIRSRKRERSSTARPTPIAPITGKSSRRTRSSWRSGWNPTGWATCCRR